MDVCMYIYKYIKGRRGWGDGCMREGENVCKMFVGGLVFVV